MGFQLVPKSVTLNDLFCVISPNSVDLWADYVKVVKDSAMYYSHTLMFSLFTALLLCCCVSFCSLLDGVCLSGNKMITYLLT